MRDEFLQLPLHAFIPQCKSETFFLLFSCRQREGEIFLQFCEPFLFEKVLMLLFLLSKKKFRTGDNDEIDTFCMTRRNIKIRTMYENELSARWNETFLFPLVGVWGQMAAQKSFFFSDEFVSRRIVLLEVLSYTILQIKLTLSEWAFCEVYSCKTPSHLRHKWAHFSMED